MDVALLLLLPLFGGYAFSRKWFATEYKAGKENGHRLYFRAGITGVILFVLAVLAHAYLSRFPFYECFERSLKDGALSFLFRPSDNGIPARDQLQLILVCFYAFFLGLIAWIPLNLLWKASIKVYVFCIAGRTPGHHLLNVPPFYLQEIQDDDFERQLIEAAYRPMPVALSMESGKEYVGFVIELSSRRSARKAVTILPLMSGFRSSEGELKFTTFYGPVYDAIEKPDDVMKHLSVDDFRLVLPTDRICALRLFDIEAYEHFQPAKESDAPAMESS